MDWAFVVGFEVEGTKGIGAGVRLWKGLSNLDATEGSSPSFITSWQVGVSYCFRAKRVKS
jgi:hypothetical protein